MGGQHAGVSKKEIPGGTVYINMLDGSEEFAPTGGKVTKRNGKPGEFSGGARKDKKG